RADRSLHAAPPRCYPGARSAFSPPGTEREVVVRLRQFRRAVRVPGILARISLGPAGRRALPPRSPLRLCCDRLGRGSLLAAPRQLLGGGPIGPRTPPPGRPPRSPAGESHWPVTGALRWWCPGVS